MNTPAHQVLLYKSGVKGDKLHAIGSFSMIYVLTHVFVC